MLPPILPQSYLPSLSQHRWALFAPRGSLAPFPPSTTFQSFSSYPSRPLRQNKSNPHRPLFNTSATSASPVLLQLYLILCLHSSAAKSVCLQHIPFLLFIRRRKRCVKDRSHYPRRRRRLPNSVAPSSGHHGCPTPLCVCLRFVNARLPLLSPHFHLNSVLCILYHAPLNSSALLVSPRLKSPPAVYISQDGRR